MDVILSSTALPYGKDLYIMSTYMHTSHLADFPLNLNASSLNILSVLIYFWILIWILGQKKERIIELEGS